MGLFPGINLGPPRTMITFRQDIFLQCLFYFILSFILFDDQ